MPVGRPISLTPNVKSKRISVTATASQTSFTVPGGYRVNNIGVFRNGARLSAGADFTAGDGSTVTLLSAATAGDTVAFDIYDTHVITDAINANSSSQTIDGDLTVTGNLSATLPGVNVGISTILDLRVGFGASIAGITTLTGTNESYTKDQGALIVEGGVGIEKNLNVGGMSVHTGIVTFSSVIDASSAGSDVRVTGNFNVAGLSSYGNDVYFNGTSGVSSVTFDQSDNALEFLDNAKARFGGSNDLEIYHDGEHSRIHDTGTGKLILAGNEINLNNAASSEYCLRTIEDGAVELYFNNSKKIETTNTGVNITGISTADDFYIGVGGTSVHTELATKASTGKSIAMAMVFG